MTTYLVNRSDVGHEWFFDAENIDDLKVQVREWLLDGGYDRRNLPIILPESFPVRCAVFQEGSYDEDGEFVCYIEIDDGVI